MDKQLQLDTPEDFGTKYLQKVIINMGPGNFSPYYIWYQTWTWRCHYYSIDIVLLLYLNFLLISQQILGRTRAVRCNDDSYRFLLNFHTYYSSSVRKYSPYFTLKITQNEPEMNVQIAKIQSLPWQMNTMWRLKLAQCTLERPLHTPDLKRKELLTLIDVICRRGSFVCLSESFGRWNMNGFPVT